MGKLSGEPKKRKRNGLPPRHRKGQDKKHQIEELDLESVVEEVEDSPVEVESAEEENASKTEEINRMTS